MIRLPNALGRLATLIRSLPPAVCLALAAIGLSLLWAYWTTFDHMAVRWWKAPQYSHGFLVPAFAVAVLWMRRQYLLPAPWQASWWGLALLAAGVALRLTGAFFYIVWFDDISLLPCLAGLCVLLGGWPVLRWSWPAIAFLFFMMPLPYSVETALAYPLRLAATQSSVFALQTVGFPALAQGTDIYLNDNVLQVAPACCGMGMLLVFFALSTAITLVIERPWVDKLVILVSAIPIAILANIARIVVTAVLFQVSSREAAQEFFHRWAGILVMMPVALGLLWLELKLLGHLLVKVDSHRPLAIDYSGPSPGRRRSRLQGVKTPAK